LPSESFDVREVRVDRLQTPSDLDAVMEIERATFNNPTTREWYEGELERPEVCFIYVLRTPARPVSGFCAFWRVSDQIHINNFAIHPELRGRGLGRHLLQAVLREAEAVGASRATLEVRRSNVAAQQLYASAGFRVAAVRPGYYTAPVEDALVLSRDEREAP
jgi:[ribosomal protein S18]-alanine N-acetyltransferase